MDQTELERIRSIDEFIKHLEPAKAPENVVITKIENGVPVLFVNVDDLRNESSVEAIRISLAEALTLNVPNIILDLAKLKDIKSWEFGVLLNSMVEVKRAGKQLILRNVQGQPLDFLRESKLDRLFKVIPTAA